MPLLLCLDEIQSIVLDDMCQEAFKALDNSTLHYLSQVSTYIFLVNADKKDLIELEHKEICKVRIAFTLIEYFHLY